MEMVVHCLFLPTGFYRVLTICWLLHSRQLQISVFNGSSPRSTATFLRFEMAINEGTLVGGVSYEQSTKFLDRLLRPYARYYVSNAPVKLCLPDYNISEYIYSWTLSTRTPVDPIYDSVPYKVPCNFNLKRFSEIHRLIEHDEVFGIKVLVVHSYPIPDTSSKNKATEYIVVTEEKKLLIMRVWGDKVDNEQHPVTDRLPEPTIVVVTNIKVTTHHGLSLSTKTYSCVLHNPHLEDESSLLDWYPRNAKEIARLLTEKTYLNSDILMPILRIDEVLPISVVHSTISEIKNAWVSVTMKLKPGQEKLWYIFCKSCKKAVTARENWNFPCSLCNFWAGFHPRCHIGVYLDDGRSSLCATLFSPDADKLINHTAAELKELDDKNVSLVDDIEKAVNGKAIVCFLKYYDKKYMGSSVRNFLILKVYMGDIIAFHPATAVNEAASTSTKLSAADAHEDAQQTGSQLFSPTTKNVLGEISSLIDGGSSINQPSSMKRRLDFNKSSPDAAATDTPNTGSQATDEGLDLIITGEVFGTAKQPNGTLL